MRAGFSGRGRQPWFVAALTGCSFLWIYLGSAWAHDARPLSLLIVEQPDQTYRANLLLPPSIDALNRPEISFPESCTVQAGGVREITDAFVQSMMVGCHGLSQGLEGHTVGIRYPLFNPSLSTLLRFQSAAGDIRSTVLAPDETKWVIPAAADWKTVSRDYLLLGIDHIWAGVDHLLFVAGLLLLAGTPRRIAVAVTGFTLAHSLTLSLSVLGFVHFPLPPIEAGIALSILFLAREIARPDPKNLARRYPLAISSSFGLLHGFGFAAALSEAGLPKSEIATALLFFNAGVEVGQLLFIAAALVVISIALACARAATVDSTWFTRPRAEWMAAYGLGIPAAFWFLQRLQAFWAG